MRICLSLIKINLNVCISCKSITNFMKSFGPFWSFWLAVSCQNIIIAGSQKKTLIP